MSIVSPPPVRVIPRPREKVAVEKNLIGGVWGAQCSRNVHKEQPSDEFASPQKYERYIPDSMTYDPIQSGTHLKILISSA